MPPDDAQPPRLLVIEDSPTDQRIFRLTLRDFNLQFAGTGEAGLELLGREIFDLVVLDYHLPTMNGDEVLAKIRDEMGLDLPVVIVTGMGGTSVAVDLLKRGAFDFVTKDELHTPRVAAAVRGSLERHRLDLDHRRAEDELRRQKEELESTLRALQEAQAQLVQGEKMASLGQLVAGVAHEINNPLSYVSNNLAVLDRDVREIAGVMELYRRRFGPETTAAIREAEERIDLDYTLGNLDRLLKSSRQGLLRVREIVANLHDFSRLDEAQRKRVAPSEVVQATVEMVRYHVRQKNVELLVQLGPMPTIWCNPGQLNQVVLNILMNSIQAVPEGSTIRIEGDAMPDDQGVRLSIADDGPGIPEAIRGKIYDPFYTTKPQGVGTGLGLWISYNIVHDHGGRIDLETEVGQGTRFTIVLPLSLPGDHA